MGFNDNGLLWSGFVCFCLSFNFSKNLSDGINNSKVIFVTVGTPINKKGNIDLSQIKEVTNQIANILKKNN